MKNKLSTAPARLGRCSDLERSSDVFGDRIDDEFDVLVRQDVMIGVLRQRLHREQVLVEVGQGLEALGVDESTGARWTGMFAPKSPTFHATRRREPRSRRVRVEALVRPRSFTNLTSTRYPSA